MMLVFCTLEIFGGTKTFVCSHADPCIQARLPTRGQDISFVAIATLILGANRSLLNKLTCFNELLLETWERGKNSS